MAAPADAGADPGPHPGTVGCPGTAADGCAGPRPYAPADSDAGVAADGSPDLSTEHAAAAVDAAVPGSDHLQPHPPVAVSVAEADAPAHRAADAGATAGPERGAYAPADAGADGAAHGLSDAAAMRDKARRCYDAKVRELELTWKHALNFPNEDPGGAACVRRNAPLSHASLTKRTALLAGVRSSCALDFPWLVDFAFRCR